MVQVIGAGLGRTGTASLKLALETLLGGPCYHMFELLQRPSDAETWAAGLRGRSVDWEQFLDGWSAIVDFPGAGAVDELATAFPDATVLLSTRDPDAWWESADRTIFSFEREHDGSTPQGRMGNAMMHRVGVDVFDRDASIAAFVAHNDRIRREYAGRLIEWQPGDGWAPLCVGLGVDEPDEDYPHANEAGGFFDQVRAALAGDVPRNADPPAGYR